MEKTYNNITTRNLNVIDKIIFHYSANDNEGYQFNAIRKDHIERRNMPDIAYNFFIEKCGYVLVGRPLWVKGDHCKGYNTTSVGVCLAGYKHFNEIQFEKAREVILLTVLTLNKNVEIFGHNDFYPDRPCPGFDIKHLR